MEINYRMYTCQHHSKIVSEFQRSIYNFHACSALFSMTSEIIICDNYLVRNFIVTYLNQGNIVKNSFDGNFGYTFDELKTCSFFMFHVSLWVTWRLIFYLLYSEVMTFNNPWLKCSTLLTRENYSKYLNPN